MSDPNEIAVDSVRGGASLFIGVGTATVITGFGSVIIGRILGPSNYALYSLALVLPTLLFSFSIFGIDVALVRYLPWFYERGEKRDADSLIGTGLFLRTVIAISFMAFGIIFSEFFARLVLERPELASFIRISNIAVAFEALVWFSFYSLQGLNQMSWSGITRILQSLFKACLSIALILVGLGVFGGILGFTFGYVISGIISITILLAKSRDSTLHRTKSMISKKKMKLIFRFGLPLYLVTIIAVVTAQYRLVLLAIFSTDVIIGNFNAAVNIAILLTGFTSPLLMVLLPAFSRIRARESGSNLIRAFTLGQRFVSFFVIPSAFIFMLFANSIIFILYGPAFDLAGSYLVLFSSIFLILALGMGVLESFFNGVGENSLTLYFWALYLILFLPIGWVLIIHEGVVGLIVAELVARMISYAFGFLIGRRKLGITTDSSGIARVFLSALFAGACTFPIILLCKSNMTLEIVFGFPLFLFVYLTMLPLTKAIHLLDLELLEEAFSKMWGINKLTNFALAYERKLLRRVGGQSSR